MCPFNFWLNWCTCASWSSKNVLSLKNILWLVLISFLLIIFICSPSGVALINLTYNSRFDKVITNFVSNHPWGLRSLREIWVNTSISSSSSMFTTLWMLLGGCLPSNLQTSTCCAVSSASQQLLKWWLVCVIIIIIIIICYQVYKIFEITYLKQTIYLFTLNNIITKQ
jgi:hypothetical protein